MVAKMTSLRHRAAWPHTDPVSGARDDTSVRPCAAGVIRSRRRTRATWREVHSWLRWVHALFSAPARGFRPGCLGNSGTPNRSARTGVPVTKRKTFACLAASAAAAACGLSVLQGSANAAAHAPAPASKHVLLISVDGMHQSDLDWYVATHPGSTLAGLIHTGTEYTNA